MIGNLLYISEQVTSPQKLHLQIRQIELGMYKIWMHFCFDLISQKECSANSLALTTKVDRNSKNRHKI